MKDTASGRNRIKPVTAIVLSYSVNFRCFPTGSGSYFSTWQRNRYQCQHTDRYIPIILLRKKWSPTSNRTVCERLQNGYHSNDHLRCTLNRRNMMINDIRYKRRLSAAFESFSHGIKKVFWKLHKKKPSLSQWSSSFWGTTHETWLSCQIFPCFL